MKAEKLYQELKALAERLGVEVSEQNFKIAGIHVRSGFCTVKGKDMFLIDKHKALSKRISILSEFLAEMDYDGVYIVPAVREHLDKYKPRQLPTPISTTDN
jgi:hypothetical protein